MKPEWLKDLNEFVHECASFCAVEEGKFYKVYGGSASGETKIVNGKETKFVEGVTKSVPFQGHVKHILREIRHGLQSAFSYTGASNLKEFQTKVKWEIISGSGKEESKIWAKYSQDTS